MNERNVVAVAERLELGDDLLGVVDDKAAKDNEAKVKLCLSDVSGSDSVTKHERS